MRILNQKNNWKHADRINLISTTSLPLCLESPKYCRSERTVSVCGSVNIRELLSGERIFHLDRCGSRCLIGKPEAPNLLCIPIGRLPFVLYCHHYVGRIGIESLQFIFSIGYFVMIDPIESDGYWICSFNCFECHPGLEIIL